MDHMPRIVRFVADCQVMIDRYMADSFPSLRRITLTIEPGKRYARIVENDAGGPRSVYCFVDMTNGDILKSGGWKKPAKHARGNIYTYKRIEDCCTPYGAVYCDTPAYARAVNEQAKAQRELLDPTGLLSDSSEEAAQVRLDLIRQHNLDVIGR